MKGEQTASADSPSPAQTAPAGLQWPWQVAAFAAAIAIVISRQPDAIFHPQFIAEDGHIWFADAYNQGWFLSLFRTYAGYFVLVPRLAAALALLFPLKFAPLVLALAGLVFQVSPVFVLLSSRLSHWGSLSFRALLALTYLAMPNCQEVNVTVTEVQWHLALVAFLVVAAPAPESPGWRCFDFVAFLLCGLTGPFAILLLPLAFAARPRLHTQTIALLGALAMIQMLALLLSGSAERVHAAHGNPMWLMKILAGQIYMGTLVGHNTLALQLETSSLLWIAAAGTIVVGICLSRVDRNMRRFGIFALIVLAASLRDPATGPLPGGLTSWRVMAGAPAIRYWFFPTLAILWMVASLIAGPKRTAGGQFLGGALLLCLLFGIVRDWRHPAYKDAHFEEYAERFATMKRGEVIEIPQTDFRGWNVELRHK